jgi:adenylylsulfate kinase
MPFGCLRAAECKSIYKCARSGEIKEFTGISSSYEIPENPDLVLDTDKLSIEECAERVIQFLKQKGIVTSHANSL